MGARVGLVVGGVLGGAVALAASVYVGTALAFAGEVPRGSHVGGVAVGGLDRAAAVTKVRAAVAGGGPVVLRAGDATAALDPAAAGLAVDAPGAVAELVGPTFAPQTVRAHLFGAGGDVSAGVDLGRLRTAVAAAAARLDTAPRDGDVEFTASGVRPVEPVAGRRVDVDGAVRLVADRWLTASGPIDVPVVARPPRVGEAEVRRAAADFGAVLAAGPLPVTVGARSVTLAAADLAPALSASPGEDGRLRLEADGARLATTLLAADPGIGTTPKDARIVLKDGRPTVVPSVAGVTVDAAKLGPVVAEALLRKGSERAASAPVTVVEPALTTQRAQALGVRERTSTFATNLTANRSRTQNLRIAARAVDGTLVMPGETFSLNGILGKRTPEKGYSQAPAISGGRLVKDYGGGVSQMATTIFNNVFFSGLEDVYHKSHSFHISRYPEGREATVNWPTVDLKWRNDSPYAVLVEAWVDSKVHVSFWSTKRYDVEATKSARTNYRAPRTIHDDRPGCVPQDANPGFDVTVGRILRQNGKVVKRETFRTSYIAEDEVTCGPRPATPPAGG